MKESVLEKRPHLIPCLIAALMLLGALGRWPYGYYQLLRFVTCGASIFVAYTAYNWQKMWAVWLFGIIAALFNPLIPIHLTREIWQPVDLICAVLFIIMVFVLKKPEEDSQKKIVREKSRPIKMGLKNRRILIIDDNEAIHKDFKAILGSREAIEISEEEAAIFGKDSESDVSKRAVFEIDSAYQGQEGLEKIKEALAINRPYAMAFVDIRMPPGWDGIETIQRIWQEYPDLQVVISTAYSDYSREDIIKILGKTDKLSFLKVPFHEVEVYQIACVMTEKWYLSQQAGM